MACFTLAILLSVFCVVPQPIELTYQRESSSTINESLLSKQEGLIEPLNS